MIRVPTEGGWRLLRHIDHARLAGLFLEQWGNAHFVTPEPREAIRVATARHDDAWAARDAAPELTPEGLPSAFTAELVGSYAAFEEIDLEAYLKVRGQATEVVAQENPYAAILISRHTVNLLTEQADLSALNTAQRALHSDFIAHQRQRQRELAQQLEGAPDWAPFLSEERLYQGFCYLQACDSLSLMVCADYPQKRSLRHEHLTHDGAQVSILCTPLGGHRFSLNPYPFAQTPLRLDVPYRAVSGNVFPEAAALREAYAAAPVRHFSAEVLAGESVTA